MAAVYSQTFSAAGTFTFVIPQYGSLTVTVNGPGGGGGGGGDINGPGVNGSSGTPASSFNANIIGNAGTFGSGGVTSGIPGANGTNGTGSGGDTNTTGGGALGGTGGPSPTTTDPGGSGGRGGLAIKTYQWPPKRGETAANYLPPGPVQIVVGAGGSLGAGDNNPDGGNGTVGGTGSVILTWTPPRISRLSQALLAPKPPGAAVGLGTFPNHQFSGRQIRNRVISY